MLFASGDTLLRLMVICLEVSLTFSLILWLRRTLKRPTAGWWFFAKLLVLGGLAAFISVVVEVTYSFNLQDLERAAPQLVARYGFSYSLLNNLSGSIIEELAKYAVAIFSLLNVQHIRKPSHVIAHMVLIGLGFSLVEDVLFLLNPDTFAPYRLLSFYVHSGTSAIVGYGLGRYLSGSTHYYRVALALLWAITLHLTYNMSVELHDMPAAPYLTLFIALYISLQIILLIQRATKEERRHTNAIKGTS